MRHAFRSTLIAAGIALSGGNAYAISTTELGNVLNVGQFGIGVDGNSLWSASATGTVYGISISGVGTTPTYGLGLNKTAMIGALAAAANVTTVTKAGTSIPVITLGSDVTFAIWSKSSALVPGNGTQIADFTFGAGLVWDPDPAISFPISVNNRSASAATYSFTSPLTLSPVLTPSNSPATLVKSSLTGTLRSNGVGTVSIAPSGSNTAIVRTTVLDGSNTVSLGVDVGNLQTFTAGLNGDTYNYAAQYNPGPGAGPFAGGPAPVTGMTLMTQTVSFTLSAGDRATLVAFSEISPVPEPTTALLMLAGLGTLAAVARRRSSKADRA